MLIAYLLVLLPSPSDCKHPGFVISFVLCDVLDCASIPDFECLVEGREGLSLVVSGLDRFIQKNGYHVSWDFYRGIKAY